MIFLDESDFLINTDQFFTFGPRLRSHSLSIEIINDDIFEADFENFLVGLVTNATELNGLQFGIQYANLTIQDDDSKLSI